MTTRTLAFEIGTEEIPAFDLAAALKQLRDLTSALFNEALIPYGEISLYSSPRRLIVLVYDVEEMTREVSQVYKGPRASIAFDEAGNPTKSALGFARGKGVGVDDLTIEEGYVYARTTLPALEIHSLLQDVLPTLIRRISWPKSQRWGTTSEYFSRPIRWIVALFGDEIIDFSFAGVPAGRLTFGHRFLAPGPFSIDTADKLIDVLRKAFVIPTESEREARIRDQVAAIEDQTGLWAELPKRTLQEVVNLCEYPTVLLGHFDEFFLEVPKEIIVDAMLVHQRYFPLFTSDGSLSNMFLITSNGSPDYAENIIDGNQRVVAARLMDAKFFYDEDRKQPFFSYVDRLDEVVFQERLGTMREKTSRIEQLSAYLSCEAQLDELTCEDISRAAHLCKADLVTSAVVEFTSVQGIMGAYYALNSGENDVVAQAIAQHYRPKYSGDDIPSSVVGRVVAIADKLDTICGLFAIDQAPTGSSDPFALRRCALGILSILTGDSGHDLQAVSLVAAIQRSLKLYAEEKIDFDIDNVSRDIISFFITRTKILLRDEGYGADSIEAVLAAGIDEPLECIARVKSLETLRNESSESYENLTLAFTRACNLSDYSLGTKVDRALLADPARVLFDSLDVVRPKVATSLCQGDYGLALDELSSLRSPIDTFFEEVLVMDDNLDVRENNLRFLNCICEVFNAVADFSKLS